MMNGSRAVRWVPAMPSDDVCVTTSGRLPFLVTQSYSFLHQNTAICFRRGPSFSFLPLTSQRQIARLQVLHSLGLLGVL